jgi:hypothetical protein
VTCCRIRTAAKLSAMSAQALAAWKCDECAGETSSVKSDSEDPKLIDVLRAIQRDIAESKRSNKAGFDLINQNLGTMQSSIDELNQKLLLVERENESLKSECKNLRAENVALVRRINSLENDVEDMQQYSRNRNVEIKGIPVTKNEDIYTILEYVAKALGVKYDRQAISVAHRLPAPKGKSFHPSIVCQFVSRTTKAEWTTAAKSRKLQSSDIHPSLRPSPVFVVDHLTQHNKRVLGHAKTQVKNGLLAYAWSKDGKILVRKTPESGVMRVRSTEEVDSIARPRGPDATAGGPQATVTATYSTVAAASPRGPPQPTPAT